MDSAIWDKPPLYYKVWSWILGNVDYKTGHVKASAPRIAEAVQWEENNSIIVPHRTTISRIIKWLDAENMVVSKNSGSSCRRFYDITVCNWSTYQSQEPELVSEESRSLYQSTDSFKEVKEVKKKKERQETPHSDWILRTIDTFYELDTTMDKPADITPAFNDLARLLKKTDIDTLKKAIRFGVTDGFWCQQFRSLRKLSTKTKDGEPYWNYFASQVESNGSTEPEKDLVDEMFKEQMEALRNGNR